MGCDYTANCLVRLRNVCAASEVRPYLRNRRASGHALTNLIKEIADLIALFATAENLYRFSLTRHYRDWRRTWSFLGARRAEHLGDRGAVMDRAEAAISRPSCRCSENTCALLMISEAQADAPARDAQAPTAPVASRRRP